MARFDSSPESVEISLQAKVKRGILYNYEPIDGGWRIYFGEEKDANPLDLTNTEAGIMLVGMEWVDLGYQTAISRGLLIRKG